MKLAINDTNEWQADMEIDEEVATKIIDALVMEGRLKFAQMFPSGIPHPSCPVFYDHDTGWASLVDDDVCVGVSCENGKWLLSVRMFPSDWPSFIDPAPTEICLDDRLVMAKTFIKYLKV